MNDRDYEYRISPNAPNIVQVRVKYAGRGRYPAWGLYMHCDSPDNAERILELLQSDQVQGIGMVQE